MKPAWDGWAWVCKIAPVAWKKYLGKKPSPLELAFNPEGAEESVPPTAVQIASAERAAKDSKLVEAVGAAIRARHAKELGKKPLEALVELQEMFVQPLERDGVAFVGFGFSAEWDPEHGLGVLTHGTSVLEVGGADVAFLAWVARRHGGEVQPAPKEPGARKPSPAARKSKPTRTAARKSKPAARKSKPAARKPKPAVRKPKPAVRKPKPTRKPQRKKR